MRRAEARQVFPTHPSRPDRRPASQGASARCTVDRQADGGIEDEALARCRHTGGAKDVWGFVSPTFPAATVAVPRRGPPLPMRSARSANLPPTKSLAVAEHLLRAPLQDVMKDPASEFDPASGETLVLVPLVLDRGRPMKANISLDAGLLEAIDEEAERRGLTRSAFFTSAALDKIGETGIQGNRTHPHKPGRRAHAGVRERKSRTKRRAGADRP